MGSVSACGDMSGLGDMGEMDKVESMVAAIAMSRYSRWYISGRVDLIEARNGWLAEGVTGWLDSGGVDRGPICGRTGRCDVDDVW